MVTYFFIFAFVFGVSVFSVAKWIAKKKPRHLQPPSLPNLPLVGSLPFLRNLENIPKFLMEKSQQLGPMFTFKAGNKLVLVLNSKEIIEEAFVKNARIFSSRPDMFMQNVANPKGKGIVFPDTTPEWKRNHKLSVSIMRDFGFGVKSVLEERILKEVESMIDYASKKGGNAFDPKQMTLQVTSNVMTRIMLGSRQSFELGIPELILEVDRYAHCLDYSFDMIPLLKFIPGFKEKITRMKTCSKKIYDILDAEIRKCLQSEEKCFVNEYINKEGPAFDRDELIFALRDLILAGTDSTAQTFLWSVVALVNHPEIQRKLQQDIDSAIPRERLPILQDQVILPYVEATIQEIHRWRTIGPLSVARSTKQDSIFRGFFIPARTMVIQNMYATNIDPMVWDDPDAFRPERFLDNDNNVVGKERIIPFSLGRRSCLGETMARAEVFLILTSFLQRFTILPPEGKDKICDEPSLPIDMLSVPKPFSVRLRERQ